MTIALTSAPSAHPSPNALGTMILERLVGAADAAPSLHGTRPWRYRLLPGSLALEIRAVPARTLRAVDPTGRALHLSVGAAVFDLRAAGHHLGWEAMVRLLPLAADPQVLARIKFADTRRAGFGSGPDLYAAIHELRGPRRPADPLPPAVDTAGPLLSDGLLAELVDAALVEGAGLAPADPAEARRLLALTTEAGRRTAADPLRREQSRHWIDRHQPGREDPLSARDAHQGVLVLTTAHDRRMDWLRAGQAMRHVLLLATSHGLRGGLLHQALEWPDLRRSLNAGPGRPGHVQMLIRLGRPAAATRTSGSVAVSRA